MDHPHKIAVFISHIYGDFQNAVCKGIIEKAEEYGYQLNFYASNDENVMGDYGLGETSLFNVPNIHSYEGIIIASGTYLIPRVQEALFDLLSNVHCPIIDICNPNTPYINIDLDNNSMIQTLVTHLFTAHNLTRLCYLGSSIHPQISLVRKNAYLKGMENHKLNHAFTTVFDCEFTNESVNNALDALLSSKSNSLSVQGIICYNDELAFIVIEELTKRGFHIPTDIVVTGCDNLPYGNQINPPLTTISLPAKELGIKAFHTLLALLDKQELSFPIRVEATPLIKGSCGCKYKKQDSPIIFTNQLNNKLIHLEAEILENIHMQGNLQVLNHIEDVVNYIAASLQKYSKITEFYFFLYSNWYEIDSNLTKLLSNDTIYRPDNIELKLGMCHGQRLSDHTFMNKQAIEDFLDTRDNNSIRLFTPLYFGEKSFGFLCFSYKDNHIYYPFTFVNWLQNLNLVLKGLSDQQNMRSIKDHLQDLNYRDDLTGLYNRHGFKYYCLLDLDRYAITQAPVTLISLEINDFQLLNANWGLEESNFALKIFAKALQTSAGSQASCARYRGSNFQILSTFSSEHEVNILFKTIQKYLMNYKELYKKDYYLEFSCSYIALTGYTENDFYEALMRIHNNNQKF